MADLVDPSVFIERAQHIPHLVGGGSWEGADCWGIVELYYRHVLGTELRDRSGIDPGPEGVQEWSDARAAGAHTYWRVVEEPEDHCLVVIRMGGLVAGHVGVFYGGRVLHSAQRLGCVAQPLRARLFRTRVSALLRYEP